MSSDTPCYALVVGGNCRLTKMIKWQCTMRCDPWGNNYTHEPFFFFPKKKRRLICTLISIRRKTSVKAFPNMLGLRTKKSLERTRKKGEGDYCNCNWELIPWLTIFNIRWQWCYIAKIIILIKSWSLGVVCYIADIILNQVYPKIVISANLAYS